LLTPVSIGKISTMNYQFPADIEHRLRMRLNKGLYANEDDLIRHAMPAK
jgi:Arc/MetJ-type ribon-helix-helix transcriptional regulator